MIEDIENSTIYLSQEMEDLYNSAIDTSNETEYLNNESIPSFKSEFLTSNLEESNP